MLAACSKEFHGQKMQVYRFMLLSTPCHVRLVCFCSLFFLLILISCKVNQ